jgi:hypothetical protein
MGLARKKKILKSNNHVGLYGDGMRANTDGIVILSSLLDAPVGDIVVLVAFTDRQVPEGKYE